MSDVETKSKRDIPAGTPAEVWSPAPVPRPLFRRRLRILPLLITLVAIAVAGVLGRAMWNTYMGAPWTRDGTVRVYVVTMAPQVSGQIVQLPVVDNQFVHKDDLLMVIDPTNYKIAVSLAEAAVQQAQVTAQNAERESRRRQELTSLAVTTEEKQTFESTALAAQAQLQQAQANLDQAKVNLQRTEIRSPVNGWVTNLLAQLGDYATVGQNKISLVDADSFWVDGYFEETNLDRIRVGDPASVKLMGSGQPDLYLGAAGAAHPGAHPHRSGAPRCGSRRRDDRDCADRPATATATQVNWRARPAKGRSLVGLIEIAH